MSKRNKRLYLLESHLKQIEKLPWRIVANNEPAIVQNVFICPICLEVIDLSKFSENEFNKIISLEDVPPKSMGGKPILITCKQCNNICGHEIDVYLFNELKYRADIQLPSSVSRKAKLKSGDNVLNATFKIKDDKNIFIELTQKNDPKKIKTHFEDIKQSRVNWKLDAQIILSDVKRNPTAANVALLKSAYLLAFQRLGYRYILNEELQIVRNQILNPKESLISRFIVGDESYIKDENKDGVYRAYYNETEILLVIFSFSLNNIKCRRAVALPPINKNIDIYETIYQQTDFKITIIEEVPILKEYAIL